jgi:hypothetical protein
MKVETPEEKLWAVGVLVLLFAFFVLVLLAYE